MNDITALPQRLKERAELAKRVGAKNPRFTADEVLALVEALEKAQQHEQEWKSLCEAAAVDLDDWLNIDDKSRELICKFADAVITRNEHIAELESRTITVKLPQRYSMLFREGFSEDYLTEMAYSEKDIQEMLRAAGIQVIEGEGQ